MRLHFIGSGDAFGSGGRFNTCFHLTGAETNVLIDCGASSLAALKQAGIDRNAIDAILFTHFHADHFGGLPFFILDAQFNAKRTRPLTLAGPPGLKDWYVRAMETAFPGSSATQPRYDLAFREYPAGQPAQIGALRVTSFPMVHDERAGPCLALRIETEGKIITYSGDGEWTEPLVAAARDADLFICEAYTRSRPLKAHMALEQLERHLPRIRPKRLVLTHMGEDMLAQRDAVSHQCAEDGLIVEI